MSAGEAMSIAENSEMRRDIVFVHIPKTAGTSLRKAFEKSAEKHFILKDYGNSPESTPALTALIKEQRLADLRQKFDRPHRGIFLSGHVPAKRYWPFFHAESFVTFVRNPVDRVLSEYNHFVTHYGWKAPVEEFVSLPRFRNMMARVLEGVDLAAFGFIGITEQFERSLDELRGFVGIELPMLRVNLGNYQQRDGTEIRFRDDLRTMVADLNRDDIDLYERLLGERSRNCRAFADRTPPPDAYQGRVGLTKHGNIAGWACNKAQEIICEVKIFQNGRLLGSVKADRYRADLKKRRVSRSGVCSFAVNRQTLTRMGADFSGTLTFKVRDTEFELQGSPLSLLSNTATESLSDASR
jgi:hypothetical protein